MNKNMNIETCANFEIGERDLECINRFAKSKLSKEEVYSFCVILCDNETDRDFERFSTNALYKMADMFLGVTGIFDHSLKSQNQKARIYKTQVIKDSQRQTQAKEEYACLKAWCYLLNCDKNKDLIREIEGGIKKEVSVSLSVGKSLCSICKMDTKKKFCGHKKGEIYENAICHRILEDPLDAYEWSFVAVPAQKNAGVTKAFKPLLGGDKNTMEILDVIKSAKGEISLTKQQGEMLCKAFLELEELSELGRTYRKALIEKAVSLACLCHLELDTKCFKGICEKLTQDELKALIKAFSEKEESNISQMPQLCTIKEKQEISNNEFII